MKKEYLFVPILIAIIQWLFFQVYLIPHINHQFKKNEETRLELLNKLTTSKVLQNNMGHINKLIQANKFQDSMTDNREEKKVLGLITEAAIHHNLKLMSIKPLESQRLPAYSIHPYALKLNGSFRNLGMFLAEMENQDKIFFVREYSIGPSEIKDVQGVTINIVYETYRMIPQ